jgi:hypothetical protein
MKTTLVPPHTCPVCKSVNDCASHASHTPQPGSISICAECGLLTIFNEDLTQRGLTKEEMEAVQASPQWRMIEQVQDAILLRGRLNGVGR